MCEIDNYTIPSEAKKREACPKCGGKLSETRRGMVEPRYLQGQDDPILYCSKCGWYEAL